MITIVLALATAAANPEAKRETTSPSPAPASAQPATEPGRRYCLSQMNTGSILVHKACRTREEWQRHGVEIRP